jgi:hypothetical protein
MVPQLRECAAYRSPTFLKHETSGYDPYPDIYWLATLGSQPHPTNHSVLAYRGAAAENPHAVADHGWAILFRETIGPGDRLRGPVKESNHHEGRVMGTRTGSRPRKQAGDVSELEPDWRPASQRQRMPMIRNQGDDGA